MADFQANDELKALGIRVIAASVDTTEEAAALVADVDDSNIAMASELDGRIVADALGAYFEDGDKPFLQPTAFVLDPDGNVTQSLYTSGPVSRLMSADVVTLVKARTSG